MKIGFLSDSPLDNLILSALSKASPREVAANKCNF